MRVAGDSGQSRWLGVLPEQFTEARLAHVADVWVSNVDKHTVEGESAVRLCNYTDVYKNDVITASMSFMRATASPDQIDRFRIRIGDTIITKDSETADDIGIPSFVEYEADDLVCGYHLAILRPDEATVVPRFLYWVMGSGPVFGQWSVRASGVTRVGIRSSDLSKVSIPLPPLEEQRAIADYLDEQTSKIDRLIAKQNQLIDTLRERRGAVVSARMDSAGHTLVPLRRIAEVIDCAHVTAEFVDDGDTAYPVASIGQCQGQLVDLSSCPYTTSHFFDHLRAGGRAPRTGDLLFIRNVSVGLVSEVTSNLPPFAVGQETVLIRPRETVSSRHLRLALTSSRAQHAIEGAMIGSTFRRINVSAIRSLPVPITDRSEQSAIADYLDTQTAKIDALIAKTQEHITLAKERRAALITAAVTGQFDVRTAAQKVGA